MSNEYVNTLQINHELNMQSIRHEEQVHDARRDVAAKSREVSDWVVTAAVLRRKLEEAEAKLEAGDTSGAITDLKAKLAASEKKNEELEETLAKQKELLREWMVSQMAFKNLLRKYGKLPNGILLKPFSA
jgi:ribosome-binding ATPase YchF (GTP1/OBG family)